MHCGVMILVAVLLSLGLAACAADSAAGRNDPAQMQQTLARAGIRRIVAVSDSLTNDEPSNWLQVMGRNLGVTTVAEAHGGWTTRSYFKEKFTGVAWAKVPADADLAIILLGSNNLFEDAGGSDASVAEAVDGVQKIAAHVKTLAPRARIMLVAPPTVALRNNKMETPPPARRIDSQSPACLAKLSRAYRTLAAQKGWLFADLYPVLDDADFVDAAHPGPEGNQKMASVVGAALVAGLR